MAGVLVLVFFKRMSRTAERTQLTIRQQIAALDVPGAICLTGGMACLLLTLQWGGSVYPWSDLIIWGLLLGFGLCIIACIGIQIFSGIDGAFPIRIITQRTVAAACILTFFLGVIVSSHQFGLQLDGELVTGAAVSYYTFPYFVSIIISSLAVGIAIAVLGHYIPFLLVGSAVLAIGCGVLCLDPGTDAHIVYQILTGIGAGACVQIPFLSVHAVLSTEDLPKGVGMIVFFNALESIVSEPITNAIQSNAFQRQWADSTTLHMLNLSVLDSIRAADLRNIVPPQLVESVIAAFEDKYRAGFHFARCYCLLGFCLRASFRMEER